MVTQSTLEQAWQVLESDAASMMIDVRTVAEWQFVGVPDLRGIGKEVRLVEWTTFPTGQPNPDFLTQATDDLDKNQPVLLLCRSGARSNAAAQALEAAGFTSVHNISAGFEGDLGADGHRAGGWKHEGLPWRQS